MAKAEWKRAVNLVDYSSVFFFVVALTVRLAVQAISWGGEIARQLARGLALAAIARAAGPGATVSEQRADGTVLAVTISGKARDELI
jgi:hypothetical protein